MDLIRWLAVILLASACTAHDMHRTKIGRSDPGTCAVQSDVRPADGCAKASIEHQVLEKNQGEYLLGVVEFDDQGWFHHAAQMNVLMEELEREASEQDLIISVFVHGWKHGADYCDPNIGCFRELMRQIVEAEKEYHDQLYARRRSDVKLRKVVGIYVAWRGLSLRGPDIIRDISFWDRKAVAAQVAQGSVRELFSRLRAFQENHNDPEWVRKHLKDGQLRARAPRNRLFILGHSFGGLITYTSVAQYLMNSAVVSRADEDSVKVKGFGDLVVLVNPAFEGARFEPLHHISQTRSYPARQDPVFIAITSTDDDATGAAFPWGRRVSTILDEYSTSPATPASSQGLDETHKSGDERDSNLRAIGHTPRYITHVLGPAEGAKLVAPAERPSTCGCPYSEDLRAAGAVDWKLETELAQKFRDENIVGGHRKRGWVRNYSGGLSLTQLARAPSPSSVDELVPDAPFWIVKTSKPIVAGHNDFWTPHLFNFLRQVYDDTLRTLETPPPPQQK